MADYQYLDQKKDDGCVFGKASTSKIAFWGTTPCDQAAALTAQLSALTVSASATTDDYAIATMTATSGFGFASVGEAYGFTMIVANLQTRMAEVQSALEAAGIVDGGTAATESDDYDYIGYGQNSDGMILGQTSSAKIAFWGAAPVDQPAALSASLSAISVSAPATTSASIVLPTSASGGYGIGGTNANEFWSVMQTVINIQTRMDEMESRLEELGVVAGGTALTSTTDYEYLDKGADDGTIFGKSSSAKIGFWGTTPVVQASTMTAAGTTITMTATTADYSITTPVTAGGYKFSTLNEGHTLLYAIYNVQTRLAQAEAYLENCGLIAAN